MAVIPIRSITSSGGRPTLDALGSPPADTVNLAARANALLVEADGRERDRLTRKLGEGDPRVRALRARLELTHAHAIGLAFEASRMSLMAEAAPDDGLLFHGHVMAGDGTPVAKAHISAYNAVTKYDARTDEQGYFRVLVGSPSSIATTRQAQAAPRTSKDGPAAASASKDGQAAVGSLTLSVLITEPAGTNLLRSPDTIEVIPGIALYRHYVADPTGR